MTICPCCGFRFEGDLLRGCQACGARAVGAPLPRPERELPAYGRSLLLVVTGTLMVLAFLAQTIIALLQRLPVSFGFWSWIAAAETASWRLKWISIPITLLVLWGGGRIYKSMARTPASFVGIRQARHGLITSALVSLMIATLIGVTVPARLRQRRMGIEAGTYAYLYTLQRALLQYSERYGTLPSDPLNDLKIIPDPDGSIAAALANIDLSAYKPSADVAVAKPKQRTLPGAVLRNASVNLPSEDPNGGGITFTNYELPLPGEDGIRGTDDDLLLRDGVIWEVSEIKKAANSASAPARTGKR